LIDSGLVGRGTTRAEDAQGTPDQSRISPNILVYEDEFNVSPAPGLDSEADHRGRQREQRQGLRSKTDLIANSWTMKFTAHESLY